MKQVYINGRFLTQQVTGEQRYAIEMLLELDTFTECNSWVVLLPNDNLVTVPELNHITCKKIGRLKGHLWEQIELPYYSRDGFLINFCDMAPICKKNQIVFIHDMAIMAHPEYYTKTFRKWHKFVYQNVVKKAKRVFTVSTFSKSELIKYLNIPAHKITVIPCACSTNLKDAPFQSEFLKKWNIDKNKRILLAVSSLSKNKNFDSLVQSLKYIKTLDTEVIIAGGCNTNEFKPIIDKYIKDVKYVGYVSDEELVTLYEIADCFVYPSFYEGFGMPPIEAMSNGCAVVSSNSTALPETCGDAALYCNPMEPRDIASKIDYILSNPEIERKFVELGYKQITKYSWHTNATKLINTISAYIN